MGFILFSPTYRAWARTHRRGHIGELAAIAAYFLAIALVVTSLAPDRLALRLLLATVLPFIVWNYMMAFVTYLHHTHPDIPWFDNEEEWRKLPRNSLTAHVQFPEWLDILLFRIMQHSAHHHHPALPWWKLTAYNKAMQDVKRYPLSVAEVRRVMSECKLYDYRNRKWVGYP